MRSIFSFILHLFLCAVIPQVSLLLVLRVAFTVGTGTPAKFQVPLGNKLLYVLDHEGLPAMCQVQPGVTIWSNIIKNSHTRGQMQKN